MSNEENKKKAQERLKAYEQRHALDRETTDERSRREWRELLSRAPDDDGVFRRLHLLDARWVAMFDDDHFDAGFDEVRLLAQAVTDVKHPKHSEAMNLLFFFVGSVRSYLMWTLTDHPDLGKPKTK